MITEMEIFWYSLLSLNLYSSLIIISFLSSVINDNLFNCILEIFGLYQGQSLHLIVYKLYWFFLFNYQALSLSLLFSAFFYRIDPFHLSSQICGHIAVHSIPFLSFYVHGVSSYCACLISHTRILCFSLFFLVSLARSLSVKN